MYENEKWYNKLPSEELDIYEPNLRLFFETMYERQMIWKRRFIDKKERPWTDNKYFQHIKFTNVYRELDRNCQWELKNIICDDELSLKDLIWKMIIFRFFNKPEFFIYGMNRWRNGIPSWDEYDEDEFYDFAQEYRKTGQTPFTAAYTMHNQPGMTRDDFFMHIVFPQIHGKLDELLDVVKNAESADEIIKFLKTFHGMARFLSYELYTDFTYITKYTNRQFMKFDANDYTSVNPGSQCGIRLIYPSIKSVKEQKNYIYKLKDLSKEWLDKISKERGESFPYLYWDKDNKQYYIGNECNITLNQIEMWLCEFSKYWKIDTCKLRYRTSFKPRTEKLILTEQ